MKTFSQGASFIHSSQYPGALLSREEKKPQRALAYHSCSPGLRRLLSELSCLFRHGYSLSKKDISSKGRFDLEPKSMSQISYKPPMWFVGTQVHLFTFRKASTLSQNALPFKGSSILRRSLSLHSVFRFVSHLTIFTSESRESYSLPFLYVFSLLPIIVFS